MITHFLIFLLKSSLILTVAYLFYHFILSKYTHFHLNRWVLILQIGIAICLPFIQLPTNSLPTEIHNGISETNGFLTLKNVKPAESSNISSHAETSSFEITFFEVLLRVYLIGLTTCLFRLGFQIVGLTKLYKNALQVDRFANYQIVWCDKSVAPCSFMKWIFLPHQKFDSNTLNHIIEHERIHIQQKHSLDMVLAEMLILCYWFNPFAWAYKKSIETNLEYLTDRVLLEKGVHKQTYMYHLLSLSVPQWRQQLGMNYNQLSLQKRITMMNTKLSSNRSLWAYVALLLMMPCFVIFNAPAQAQSQSLNIEDSQLNVALIITEDASEKDLKQLEQEVTNLELDWEFSFKDLSFHENGKINRISTQVRFGGGSVASFRGYGSQKTFIPIIFGFYDNGVSFTGTLKNEHLDELASRYDEIILLGAGMNLSKNSLNSFHSKLTFLTEQANKEQLADLEKNNWKSTYRGRDGFSSVDETTWSRLEERLKGFNTNNIWYIVNDGKKMTSPPNIPWNKMKAINLERLFKNTYIPHTTILEKKEITEVSVYIELK